MRASQMAQNSGFRTSRRWPPALRSEISRRISIRRFPNRLMPDSWEWTRRPALFVLHLSKKLVRTRFALAGAGPTQRAPLRQSARCPRTHPKPSSPDLRSLCPFFRPFRRLTSRSPVRRNRCAGRNHLRFSTGRHPARRAGILARVCRTRPERTAWRLRGLRM